MNNFETIYLDAKVKKIDDKIASAIKKANLQYPHPAIAYFRAIYAKADSATPNGNGVILDKSVKKQIKYLIGTQVNKNHLRYGNIMGHIIDAYMNDNEEIEIVFTFDKDVYSKEYEEALKLMDENSLTVSFELRVSKENITIVDGKYKKIKKPDFLGVGLLFGVKPAYDNAFVLEQAMKIIEDAFNQPDEELVYASVQDISKKWTYIGELLEKVINEKKLSLNKEDNNMDEKTKAALMAKFKEDVIAELGEEAVKDWDESRWEAELKARAEAEETAQADAETPSEENAESTETAEESQVEENAEGAQEEEATEEVEAEESAEENVEENAEIHNRKIKETRMYDVTEDSEAGTMEVVEIVQTEEEEDGKVVMSETKVRNTVYTQAKLDEAVAQAKEEVRAELQAEFDKKEAFIKENAQKVADIRAEFGDFVKDYSDEELFDESKMEIAKLKKENAELKASKNSENDEEINASEESDEVNEELNASEEETVTIDESASKKNLLMAYLKQRKNK